MNIKYDDYGYPEKIICPNCCGIGFDVDSLDHKCYRCNGTGKIYVGEEKDVKFG